MIDQFTFFCLANEDKQFLSGYVSPRLEASTFKQIPVSELARTKKLLKQLGYRARIVYRGPRTGQIDPSFTRARDATHFTVYPA
jgi:hypothetical protein